MKTYIYDAELWCEKCAGQIMARLAKEDEVPDDVSDESKYDSDDWPKGPYPHGGGESDGPAHCAGCDVFLKNPLTEHGVEWVKECLQSYVDGLEDKDKNSVADYLRGRRGGIRIDENHTHLIDWTEFYGIPFPMPESCVNAFRLGDACANWAIDHIFGNNPKSDLAKFPECPQQGDWDHLNAACIGREPTEKEREQFRMGFYKTMRSLKQKELKND